MKLIEKINKTTDENMRRYITAMINNKQNSFHI